MERKINVTIWNEYHHEKHEERIKNVYPDGIHGAIKNKLEAVKERKVNHQLY